MRQKWNRREWSYGRDIPGEVVEKSSYLGSASQLGLDCSTLGKECMVWMQPIYSSEEKLSSRYCCLKFPSIPSSGGNGKGFKEFANRSVCRIQYQNLYSVGYHLLHSSGTGKHSLVWALHKKWSHGFLFTTLEIGKFHLSHVHWHLIWESIVFRGCIKVTPNYGLLYGPHILASGSPLILLRSGLYVWPSWHIVVKYYYIFIYSL